MSWPSNYPESPADDEDRTATSSDMGSVNGLLKDFKVGFTYAVKNILSFGLAMIGVMFITVLLLLAILLFIGIPILLTLGIPFLVTIVETIATGFTVSSGLALVLLIMLLILPILGPFFIALGSLFGMAREIVESDGTQAESAFSWYGKRGLSLLGGGVLHFLVTLAPIISAFLSIIYPIWNPPTDVELRIIIFLIVIWIILVNGMLSLTFPGIIDGLSVFRAAHRSVRLTCQFPGRVLGAWSIIALLIGVPILPIINELTFLWIPFFPQRILEIYSPIAIISLIFIIIPAVSIVLTRIYMILTAKVDTTYTHYSGGE